MKECDGNGLSGHEDDSGLGDDRQILDQGLVEDGPTGNGLRLAQVLEEVRLIIR